MVTGLRSSQTKLLAGIVLKGGKLLTCAGRKTLRTRKRLLVFTLTLVFALCSMLIHTVFWYRAMYLSTYLF